MLLLLYTEAFYCYFTRSSINLCLNLIRMFCLYIYIYIYMVNAQINCNEYVKINK